MNTDDISRWASREPFETLQLCLAYIRENHPQDFISTNVKQIGSGAPIQAQRPVFLYRGEVGWYPACTSRMQRVRDGCFSDVTTDDLEAIHVDLDHEIQSRLAVDQMLSAGLLQHYEFPTALIDASSSLTTAAFFSRYGAGPENRGAIAVFDVDILAQNAIVIDLSSHPRAVRPRRQLAYGVYHRSLTDIKSPEAMQAMGIRWYAFKSDPQQLERVSSGTGLLSVADDETAGILRLWLDDSIAKLNKAPDPVARYLAHRIAHCPMVSAAKSWWKPRQPKTVELITAAQAGIVIDEHKEITDSMRLWSRNYPNVVKRPLP